MGRSVERRKISRPPCVEELRNLLKMKDGVFSAETRPVPELHARPAILERIAQSGETFQDALISTLKLAIAQLRYPEHYKNAIRWQFGIDRESQRSNWERRLEEAYKLAKLSKGEYWTDKLKKDGPGFEKTSVSFMLLTGIVEALDNPELLEAPLTESDDILLSPSSLVDDAPVAEQPGIPQRVIRIGRLEIPAAISVATCDKGQSSTQELLLEFEKDLRPSRADPEEWPLLEAQLLPKLQEEARQRIAKFEDGPALDLVHLEHRPSTPDGPHHYKIGVAKTSYYLWAATSNSLDRNLTSLPELTDRLGHPTLREGWDCDPSTLADLTRLPAPAFMGVCVVVIAEGQIVVLKRQGDHFVAVKGAHFVGEGMEPKDRDASGRFSPESAAWRGCSEELGVGPDDFHSFIPSGLIIDTKRWQPLFSFVAECKLTIPKLEARMRHAQDKYETALGEIAACLPWTVQDEQTLALLAGDDPKYTLASNHAQAALLHALYYADGRQAVEDRLTADVKRKL
jgi:hypothetical protein